MEKYKSDKYLFDRVKTTGCKESFEMLFDRYYSPLCNFAYLFIKDEDACEEIVSDVFVNIWKKRKDIEIKTELKYYLYKSTKNQLIGYLRKQKPTTSAHNREIVESDIINFQSPETLLIKKELNSKIKELLDELPKQSGLVLRLKKIDGLRYKEIAELLNISEKTVENHITNALKKIKQLLENHNELREYFKSLR